MAAQIVHQNPRAPHSVQILFAEYGFAHVEEHVAASSNCVADVELVQLSPGNVHARRKHRHRRDFDRTAVVDQTSRGRDAEVRGLVDAGGVRNCKRAQVDGVGCNGVDDEHALLAHEVPPLRHGQRNGTDLSRCCLTDALARDARCLICGALGLLAVHYGGVDSVALEGVLGETVPQHGSGESSEQEGRFGVVGVHVLGFDARKVVHFALVLLAGSYRRPLAPRARGGLEALEGLNLPWGSLDLVPLDRLKCLVHDVVGAHSGLAARVVGSRGPGGALARRLLHRDAHLRTLLVGRRVSLGKQTESQCRRAISHTWTARVGEHSFPLLHRTRTGASGVVHDAAVFGGLRAGSPIESKRVQPVGHAVHHIFGEKRRRALDVCKNTAKLHSFASCLLLYRTLMEKSLWLNIRAIRYPAPTIHSTLTLLRSCE